MTLRSIPPANRQPLHRFSTMRSATRIGMTFVGGQTGQARPIAPPREIFQPRIVRPDPQRAIYYAAIQSLAKKLDELIADATEEGEIKFWQDRRKQLKGI